jgi:predicted amidohydrolase
VGVAICFESVNPETCAALRANGAEVILAPYANGTQPAEITDPQRRQRKWVWQRPVENHVWYFAADNTAAFIISPEGKLVALAPPDQPGEGMVVHAVPADAR